MPAGSELSIVASEPAASATHVGGSVTLSLTLHAAAVAVAAGAGWWMDNRVDMPHGHASPPSAQAVRLTASVSSTTQVAQFQSLSETRADQSESISEPDTDQPKETPVSRNLWSDVDRPLQEQVYADLVEALNRERSTKKSQSTKSETTPESANRTSESELPNKAIKSEAANSAASTESHAAIASQTMGARVDVVAKPLPANQPPRFPPEALREGRGGRVVLRVTVSDTGSVTDLLVMRTSGHPDLDRAAMAGVARWSFEPARRLGLRVTQTIAVPISFEFE